MGMRSLSPLDGRYHQQVSELEQYLSEWALIKYRLRVEIEWLIFMGETPEITHVRTLDADEADILRSFVHQFDDSCALEIKTIEEETRHDVKALEYWIKGRLSRTTMVDLSESVHFGCTSEDINNLAYALMLKDALTSVWLPRARTLVDKVEKVAETAAQVPMLGHTHGQPASPTTLGKEMAVFIYRWRRQLRQLERAEFLGKFSGAVGAFNAQVAAYPHAPWVKIAQAFVESLGLAYNPLTTQIEPHDYLAEILMTLTRFNLIGIDFDRDIWSYISMDYFRLKVIGREVGSSTMPHKVNPINFENAEANFGVSNALLEHLAGSLPISRMQRDLTDSSRLRNLGVAVGHSLVGVTSTLAGVERLSVNQSALAKDLDGSWEVLAEALQTVMRKWGVPKPYERLKELTRGNRASREELHAFINGLELPASEKERLLAMTPFGYTGLASELVGNVKSEGMKGEDFSG
jgi:adenylosuccinate lyase